MFSEDEENEAMRVGLERARKLAIPEDTARMYLDAARQMGDAWGFDEDMSTWAKKMPVKSWALTPEAARKAIVEKNFILPSTTPEIGPGAWDSEEELENWALDAIDEAIEHVASGRMFWFDQAPHASIIEKEASRGLKMLAERFIRHPFEEGYVFCLNYDALPGSAEHTGISMNTGEVLVITPLRDRIGVEIFRFSATDFMGRRGLLPCFHMALLVEPSPPTDDRPPQTVIQRIGLASHYDDPLDEHRYELQEWHYSHIAIYALMVLNTDFVPMETVKADAKLNKARIKRGAEPLPDYTHVHTEDYVTALTGRMRGKVEPGAGTHASPAPHLRRGHRRWLDEAHTRSTWVRDCLVNVRKGEFGGTPRRFYDASKLQ